MGRKLKNALSLCRVLFGAIPEITTAGFLTSFTLGTANNLALVI